MGKTRFQDAWLGEEAYLSWLTPDIKDHYKANCKLCKKSFDVSAMGESAVKSHMKGSKHQQKVRAVRTNPSVFSHFNPKSNAPVSGSQGSTCENPDDRPTPTVSSSASTSKLTVVSLEDQWRAEVLWTMKVVTSHYSYNSCTDVEKLFQNMFPDSDIAKKFTCGEKKCSYILCHGLAPYFKLQQRDFLRGVDSFVILFDESMNKFTKNKQMDFHVRFFDDTVNQVTTRYYTSTFMGHAYATTMVDEFVKLRWGS